MSTTLHWVHDVPAFADSVQLPVDLLDVDLSVFTGVTATLTDPSGATVSLTGATFTLDSGAEEVSIHWGTTPRFETPGLYSLQLALTGAGGIKQRLAPIPVVVQDEDGWYSVDGARAAMGDDFTRDDYQAYVLLECAKQSILAYAPALAEDAATPINYKQMQLAQARNLLNMAKTDPSQTDDGSFFVIRPYPLDNFIKQALRPRTIHGWSLAVPSPTEGYYL